MTLEETLQEHEDDDLTLSTNFVNNNRSTN